MIPLGMTIKYKKHHIQIKSNIKFSGGENKQLIIIKKAAI
jgi:hypothetical protein